MVRGEKKKKEQRKRCLDAIEDTECQPLQTIADGVALAFPLAVPMGTRLYAAVIALISTSNIPATIFGMF